MSTRYLQWVIPGEQPEYAPFEITDAMIKRGAKVLKKRLLTWGPHDVLTVLAADVLEAVFSEVQP